MKNTIITFAPLPSVLPESIRKVLDQNFISFTNRRMEAEIINDPPRVTGKFEEGILGLERNSCSLNAYINAGEKMHPIKIVTIYDNAVLPAQATFDGSPDDQRFITGKVKTFWGAEDGFYGAPTILCDPAQESVTISMYIDANIDLDKYRRALLHAQHIVERIIRQANCVRQLIQAFRTVPVNSGFVRRSIKELYAAIGQW